MTNSDNEQSIREWKVRQFNAFGKPEIMHKAGVSPTQPMAPAAVVDLEGPDGGGGAAHIALVPGTGDG